MTDKQLGLILSQYHAQLFKIFAKLSETLREIDGIECHEMVMFSDAPPQKLAPVVLDELCDFIESLEEQSDNLLDTPKSKDFLMDKGFSIGYSVGQRP